MNPWLIHRNLDCFGPDAETYKPERWLGDDEKVRQMEKYLISVSNYWQLLSARLSPFFAIANHTPSSALDTMPALDATWQC